MSSRVVTGLAKISLALRHRATREALPRGLSPAQGQVLALLRSRPDGMRLSAVAEAMAVTAATASDTVSSLVDKGLVRKEKDAADGRAIAILLTPAGLREADAASEWPDFLQLAVEELNASEKGAFLIGLVKMIRNLQERGEIPPSKMCVTCVHFQPNVHEAGDNPHHCTYVDAAFGSSALRIDCPEHMPSSPSKRDEDWQRFSTS